MGNSNIAASVPQGTHDGQKASSVAKFYSSDAWIEGKATKQIEDVTALEGISKVAAFPDLHPGRYGPVGITALSDRIHPLLVGNDIGCGMALFEFDMPIRKLKVDKVADRLRALEGPWDGDQGGRLSEIGIDPDCFPRSIGTIGGGNHFCEVQAVDDLIEEGSGLDRHLAYLLVHSGSRGFGEFVVSGVPDGMGLDLDPSSSVGKAYLQGHDAAVRWAALNRLIVAERAAEALRCDVRLVTDVPHNMVRQGQGGWIHHKGAAHAIEGALVPVAGSRASLSYIVRAADDLSESMGGMSHGAGRKYDRASMHHRVGGSRSERDAMARNPWGGRIVCEDKGLLLEEAAEAYKDAGRVVSDLERFGLAAPIASMRPVITFKKARDEEPVRDARKGRNNR